MDDTGNFDIGYNIKQDIIMKKSIPLCGVQHSVIMSDFLMSETQHPIIVNIYIFNIHSSYILEVL